MNTQTQVFVIAASRSQAKDFRDLFGAAFLDSSDRPHIIQDKIRRFDNGDIRVLVVCEQTMAHGYNLRPAGSFSTVFLRGELV